MKKKYPKILGSLKAILPLVDHRRFELHALSRLCRDAIPLCTRLSLQASPKLRSDDFLTEAFTEFQKPRLHRKYYGVGTALGCCAFKMKVDD